MANSWFKEGFEHIEIVTLKKTTAIRILPVAYFLSTKFEAFHSRGKDPRTSHDLEDIIFVMDNRLNMVEEILTSPQHVLHHLQFEFTKLLSPTMEEAVYGHMNPLSRKDRFPLLMNKLHEVINPKR